MLTLPTHHGAGYILRRNGLLKHKNNMFKMNDANVIMFMGDKKTQNFT